MNTRETGARERILRTACGLFPQRGIRDVGVDELIETAGVAKATFYKHFPSKNALVLAFLDHCGQEWARELHLNRTARADTPEAGLMAIFDLLAEGRHMNGFDGGNFIRVLLEMGPEHPLGRACIGHLMRIRGDIAVLAQEAGLKNTAAFARSWHLLVKGSVISAVEGDHDGILCARRMGVLMIEQHRSAGSTGPA